MTGFDDRFGAAPAPSGLPAQPYPSSGPQPAFGAPPVFGAPAQPGQAWAPANHAPPRSKAWGTQQIITAVVAGVVVLAALGFGWNYWQTHRAIGVPASLGGIPRLTGTAADQVTAFATGSLKNEVHGKKLAVAVYATPGAKDIIVLTGVRGRLMSVDDDLASGGTAARTQVGHNTCASFSGGVVCERTSAHLTEAVVADGTTMSMPQVSAMLDEAWAHA